jgi:NADH-quinone oxidoreductase subunit J
VSARLVFDAAAAVAIVFAAVMAVHRHPVKSVLALVVSFFALAAAYVLLAAPFIAAIQVIVYAGAILVLFLFVLMLLNLPQETRTADTRPVQRLLAGVGLVVFAFLLLALLRAHGTSIPAAAAPDTAGGEIAPLARLLFSDYLLPFEALSVLLLAALVGAFLLARPETGA